MQNLFDHHLESPENTVQWRKTLSPLAFSVNPERAFLNARAQGRKGYISIRFLQRPFVRITTILEIT